MKVYFAHSMEIYGTPESRKAASQIRRLIPGCELINPENLSWPNLEKRFGKEGAFSHVITISDIIVAVEYEKFVGRGVCKEVSNAIINSKKAYALRSASLYEILYLNHAESYSMVHYCKLVCSKRKTPRIEDARRILRTRSFSDRPPR